MRITAFIEKYREIKVFLVCFGTGEWQLVSIIGWLECTPYKYYEVTVIL